MGSTEDADGEVLGQLKSVVEDHNQIHVEFNLKIVVHVGGARVRIWEQHIKRNFEVWQYISICNLDVLDFSRIRFLLKGFHSNKLNLNRLYFDFGLFQYQEPVEGLIEAAIN